MLTRKFAETIGDRPFGRSQKFFVRISNILFSIIGCMGLFLTNKAVPDQQLDTDSKLNIFETGTKA
jgi:hypothetical protein